MFIQELVQPFVFHGLAPAAHHLSTAGAPASKHLLAQHPCMYFYVKSAAAAAAAAAAAHEFLELNLQSRLDLNVSRCSPMCARTLEPLPQPGLEVQFGMMLKKLLKQDVCGVRATSMKFKREATCSVVVWCVSLTARSSKAPES
eukprot:1143677-Pelagomonas_calceolata.AAC.2